EYEIVGDPVPIVNFADVKVGESFEIALEFAVKPEVELGNYKGIEVEKMDAEATEEEVSAKLDDMLKANVVLEPKEDGVLENGNTAIFDFEGFESGVPFEGGKAENYELEIGSNQFIPGFEDQMVGMKAGEEKDINVTFPEQYQAENLAGKDAVFKVKLHEVKQKSVTELNDEWVSTLNRDEKTLEDLKAALAKEIKENKENQNKNIAIETALNKIAETTKVDVPVEMIDYETNQQIKNIENQAKQYGLDFKTYVSLTGMTEEDLRKQINEESSKRVLNSLIIEAVSKAEKFEITEAELETKYIEVASMYQMDVAEVKKHLTDDLLKRDIEFAKAIDFIFDNIKFV
ncbi:MAG TPA: trigger factor, partial [Acholeplasma sp.]|nr:trigger factor [Acholeplasma sp.]